MAFHIFIMVGYRDFKFVNWGCVQSRDVIKFLQITDNMIWRKRYTR